MIMSATTYNFFSLNLWATNERKKNMKEYRKREFSVVKVPFSLYCFFLKKVAYFACPTLNIIVSFFAFHKESGKKRTKEKKLTEN